MEANQNMHETIKKVLEDDNASPTIKSASRLLGAIHDDFTKWHLADKERVSDNELANALNMVISHLAMELIAYKVANKDMDFVESAHRFSVAFDNAMKNKSAELLIMSIEEELFK